MRGLRLAPRLGALALPCGPSDAEGAWTRVAGFVIRRHTHRLKIRVSLQDSLLERVENGLRLVLAL